MDSCHIFNFLFGTRKATTELRKHFRSNVEESTKNIDTSLSEEMQRREQPPSSPLKKIQTKITNLKNSALRTLEESHCPQSDSLSGTYRATFVAPVDVCDNGEPENGNDQDINFLGGGSSENLEVTHLSMDIKSEETIDNTQWISYGSGSVRENIVLYDEKTNQTSNDDEAYKFKATEILGLSTIFSSHESEELDSIQLDKKEQSDASTRRDEFNYKFQDENRSKSKRVMNLVQSFELSVGNQSNQLASESSDSPRTPIKMRWPPEQDHTKPKGKPTAIVKHLPPKTLPKSNKLKFLHLQMRLGKPTKIENLFQDEIFLSRFFSLLEPIERCSAAQVCRLWRNILYSDHIYSRGLISVIDCTQLRREHLFDCIVNSLQSARLKHYNQLTSCQFNHQPLGCTQSTKQHSLDANNNPYRSTATQRASKNDLDALQLDKDEIWRIQELCQRFTRGSNNYTPRSIVHEQNSPTINGINQNQQTITSKSSSIPSQISSTLSSASISSLLSPFSESSRVESIKERLYYTLDRRGFEGICLYGACDDDIEDFVSKTPAEAHRRIIAGRLDNCCITDRGLDMFISTFDRIEELELSGCNEITNSIELKTLEHLKRLTITDCINIADSLASRLSPIIGQLNKLTLQAYHLTDAFLEYIGLNADASNLYQLELPNCKEISNHGMLTIAKHFCNLESLSISGSTKISDAGIEILAEQAKSLRSLDLSWCTKITDISLECIACDLSNNLTELILDRNTNITDIGLGYLATITGLTLFYIRWCPRITDTGLESILMIKKLRNLSVAGLHQITARSLLCLIEAPSLVEVELTNCPAVNSDLLRYLSEKMPKCNIIY